MNEFQILVIAFLIILSITLPNFIITVFEFKDANEDLKNAINENIKAQKSLQEEIDKLTLMRKMQADFNQIPELDCKTLVRNLMDMKYAYNKAVFDNAHAKSNECLSKVYDIRYTDHERLTNYIIDNKIDLKNFTVTYVETFYEDGQYLGSVFEVKEN